MSTKITKHSSILVQEDATPQATVNHFLQIARVKHHVHAVVSTICMDNLAKVSSFCKRSSTALSTFSVRLEVEWALLAPKLATKELQVDNNEESSPHNCRLIRDDKPPEVPAAFVARSTQGLVM
jgi:hypothetical protein